MGRAFVRIIIFCFFLTGLFSPAVAKRVALVIGNSAYEHATKLDNPKNDADALAAVLERLDFKVVKGIDLKRSEFEKTIRAFSRAIRGADVALLFYAGHGLQVNGRNYLAPTDARLSDEADLDFETIPIRTILKQMEREVKTNLVFLDACRNNPLARNLARSMGTRSTSVGRGLARVDSGVGTLIAFATEPGNVALDGKGSNSPFTSALLKHIETPGLDIAQLMRRVRKEVLNKTSGKQVPWNNSSLTGDFFFAGRVKVTAGNEKPQDDKRITALQDELQKLKQQMKTKPTAKQKPKDDGKLATLQKELVELRQELRKRPQAKPEPRDDKKMEAMQKELAALKQRLDEKSLQPGKTVSPNDPKVAVGTYPKKPKAAASRSFSPGDEFEECYACPTMVVIPAGRFWMGSPKSERTRADSEGPLHRVRIPAPFAVGKFEVTFADWNACIADSGCGGHHPDDHGWGRGKRPVINVSWNDAKAYVRWVSKRTDKEYRLLSEAEWEYAARSGTKTPFSTGQQISTKQANFNGDFTTNSIADDPYDGSPKWVDRKKTVPVGSYKSNIFGLHDMHGNVSEWVEDCWNRNYSSAPADGSAQTNGDCSRRVLRGGSWNYRSRHLRSASRDGSNTGFRSDYPGFRVARTLTRTELGK